MSGSSSDLLTNPRPAGLWVADTAKMFRPETRDSLQRRCERTWRETNVEVVIATVEAVDGPLTAFAERLFSRWQIGDRSGGRGLLVLIVRKDNRIEVVQGPGLGSGVATEWTDQVKGGIVLPSAPKVTMSGAAQRGLAKAPGSALEPPQPRKVDKMAAGSSSGGGKTRAKALEEPRRGPTFEIDWDELTVPLLLISLVFGGLVVIWGSMRRSRPEHPCEHCEIYVPRMEETREHRTLSEGQQYEERLGAVRYRLYICPHCGHPKEVAFIGWASGFTPCPACLCRTLATDAVTQTGVIDGDVRELKVVEKCRYCNFRKTSLRRVSVSGTESSEGGPATDEERSA